MSLLPGVVNSYNVYKGANKLIGISGEIELPELEALQAHSEDNARAHEENQCGNAPHNAVQPTVAGSDCAIDIHTLSP